MSNIAACKTSAECVLIVVDVQNGFLPGGNLGIQGADRVIPVINNLASRFTNVVLTQDWHPAGHMSFASAHPGKKLFEVIEVDYGPQMLWPDHCIQGTADAQISEDLDIVHAQLIIRKGYNPQVDSYSAFQEADQKTMTGLSAYLKERGLKHCFICGLATDFCVAWTAIDACHQGFRATVIEDACQSIDQGGSLSAAWEKMTAAGVQRIQAKNLVL